MRIKKIATFFFSMPFMGILLFSLSAAMAAATLIEHRGGTEAARAWVYDTWWFEMLFFLGAVNLTGNMIRYRSWRKFPVFLYHLAFLFILAGAAITRYISYEGTMHIREGESSNILYTYEKYLYGSVIEEEGEHPFAYITHFLPGHKTHFHRILSTGQGKVSIEVVEYLPRVMRHLVPDPGGKRYLSLVILTGGERKELLLGEGEGSTFQGSRIIFGGNAEDAAFRIAPHNEGLIFTSPDTVYRVTMTSGGRRDTLLPGEAHPFERGNLYLAGSFEVVLKQVHPPSRLRWQPAPENENGPAGIRVRISANHQHLEAVLAQQYYSTAPTDTFPIGSLRIAMAYGPRPVLLPFSLYLKDFRIERYPGSESPSSYASEVVLVDTTAGIRIPYNIHMNHTLSYRGYKFFQSSYDPDERGTILSVNHDKAGTTVTYLGYLLMTLGMLLSIFHPKGRFMTLARRTGISGNKAAVLLGVWLVTTFLPAPASAQEGIPQARAQAFESVLVQDHGGRIKPFYTLASEALRKISRKERYKGMSPVQVVLGMYFEPHKWQREAMIKVSGKMLPGMLGAREGYVAYADLFDPSEHYSYKLRKYVQEAYRKAPGERSKFDQDVIKLDERVNVCYLIYSGRLFRLFPLKDDPARRWYSPAEAADHFTGKEEAFVIDLLDRWYRATDEKEADGLLKKLKEFQLQEAGSYLPSPLQIKLEILYMKADPFIRLAMWYGLWGFVLVVFLFVRLLRQLPVEGRAARPFVGLLALGFLVHTLGLGVRWYISGHAPWSNGYESMIYIAWAGMLAGLVFVRKSAFSLAAAALLSALALFVAHLSWMNPEITNLVPVLRSYWLTLHVSVITASYGFLGLGMLLGLINLFLYLLTTPRSVKTLVPQQRLLTQVNEMALILGLYLLTIGTFLGGVWANESWGRYWGWDPKETWSLITMLVYAFVIHMRFIPGLKGEFAFNTASVLAFFSVIMTYVGVNYYLTGLHSYAQGESAPVLSGILATLVILLTLIFFAWYRKKRTEGIMSQGE